MRAVRIIGLGYVGLPLAVAFAQEGREVIAVDVDPRKSAGPDSRRTIRGVGDRYWVHRPRDVQTVEAGSGAKVTIVVNVEGENAARLERIATER